MNNRTFSKMADDVEQALQNLRDSEAIVLRLGTELGHAQEHAREARSELETARDALFEAHPELRPVAAHRVTVGEELLGSGWTPPAEPGATVFEESDDPDRIPVP